MIEPDIPGHSNIVESGVNHHKPKPTNQWNRDCEGNYVLSKIRYSAVQVYK
jgi:hypothetical protein